MYESRTTCAEVKAIILPRECMNKKKNLKTNPYNFMKLSILNT